MTRRPGRRVVALLVGAGIGLLALGGCTRPFVSPIAVPPYRNHTPAPYDETWSALIRVLVADNVPLRVVAKDSGIVASDDFVSPIGVYADCGRFGDAVVEGEALIAFTVFVQPGGEGGTEVQVTSKMRTQSYRRGSSGWFKTEPVYQCVSTGRWEANLSDALRHRGKE